MNLKIFFCSIVPIAFLFSCGEVWQEPEKEKKSDIFEIKKKDGKKYRPEQPIKFSHKIHAAGFSNMDCKKCHANYFPKDSVKINPLNKNPLKDVAVKQIPINHPKGLGDITDCNRCHY